MTGQVKYNLPRIAWKLGSDRALPSCLRFLLLLRCSSYTKCPFSDLLPELPLFLVLHGLALVSPTS